MHGKYDSPSTVCSRTSSQIAKVALLNSRGACLPALQACPIWGLAFRRSLAGAVRLKADLGGAAEVSKCQ